MIYAIDFDGTLCEDKYPEIGKPFLKRIDKLKKFKERGDRLILWTCRQGKQLEEAVDWCKNYGLQFDAINQNIPEIQKEWRGDTRKIYCDFYIDDKNYSPSRLDV